jgi:hypothetical protein
MAGLKTLVVVMGVMLVAGVAILIVVIAGRVSQKPAPASAQPFAAAPIDIPAGSRIEAMSTGPDRVVLDVVLADGNRQLLVIDLATGRRIGTIPLRTAP